MSIRKERNTNNKEEEKYQLYDFLEYNVFMSLGLFHIVKEPKPAYIMNVLAFVLIYILFLFIVAMLSYTCYLVRENTNLMVSVLQPFILMLGVPMCALVKLSVPDSLSDVIKMLRDNVFSYKEGLDEIQINFKVNRIRLIRRSEIIFRGLYVVQLFSNIFYSVYKCLLIDIDTSQSILNPYLPIPIYLPFDTSTKFSFVVAFLLISICNIITSCTCPMIFRVFMGCLQQLICQIEILNYSLLNIEKRAVRRMQLEGYRKEDIGDGSLIYESEAFQSCLQSCLKDNIKHHQAITRLREAMAPMVEGTHTVTVVLFSALIAFSSYAFLRDTTINIPLLLTVGGATLAYFILSYMGQAIGNSSEETLFALYSTPWSSCGKDFNNLLKIIMPNMLNPIEFRTKGIRLPLSLSIYGEMMNFAYKVVLFLNQL